MSHVTRGLLVRTERDIQRIVDAIIDLQLRMYEVEHRLDAVELSIGTPERVVGEVMDYAGDTPPALWLLCDGSEVSRTTYAALFTAIGTTWGIGDGVDTFNVPDMRGRVGAGKDNMGGTTAGRVTAAGSGMTGTTLGEVGGDEHLQEHVHPL